MGLLYLLPSWKIQLQLRVSRIDSRSFLPLFLSEKQLNVAKCNLDISSNMIVPWDLIKSLKILGVLDYVLS
jgi:hypothetical protein